MSNLAKSADYSSDDEEDEESESEEEEQSKVVKGNVDSKPPERQNPQEEEESSEEEEDSETDNDAHKYNTVRREKNTAAAAKAANHTNPAGKRGRDGEGKDEEPATKKSKETKGDKGRGVVGPASPTRSNKADPGGKRSKAPVSKSKLEKAKPLPVEKEESTKAAPANRKRKASPPPVNGSSRQKGDGSEKNSPPRPKTPFMWTSPLEIALATMLWNSKKHGGPLPRTKNDPYWTKLVKELSSEGVAITEAQLSEKVRRMKKKWEAFKDKGGDNPGKNAHEQKIFGIWDGIWGTGLPVGKQAARPGTPPGAPDEEEEEESSEEEEVATPAIRANKVPAQASRKEESSESEEEEEEESSGPKKGGLSHDGTNKDGTAFSPTAVVSPFVSKPRLEYTPIIPKADKKKRRGDDGTIPEQGGSEESPDEEEREGGASVAVVELLNSLKKESFAILHEVRSSCLEALNNIRKQTTTVLDDMKDVNSRIGVNMPSSGLWRMNGGSVPSLDRGLLEDFMTTTLRSGENGANSSSAAELKGLWRQLRAEEMDLLEKRIQLTLKQVKLAKKEFEEHEK